VSDFSSAQKAVAEPLRVHVGFSCGRETLGGGAPLWALILPAQKRRGRETAMPVYRMYFWTKGPDQIPTRDDFQADDDVSAIRIARVLYDTCSDVCDYFELWQGERQIPARQADQQRTTLADLIEAHQNVVIEREEHIGQSRRLLARSRRLIEALDRTKSAAKHKFQ
jgi:hypothetical protein